MYFKAIQISKYFLQPYYFIYSTNFFFSKNKNLNLYDRAMLALNQTKRNTKCKIIKLKKKMGKKCVAWSSAAYTMQIEREEGEK